MKMKDDAASLVTGILMLSEVERKNNEAKRQQQYRNDELSEENSNLQEENQAAKKKNNALKADNNDLLDDVQNLSLQNRALYEKAVELQDEVDEYKLLLCKPMAEIAQKHGNFQETYEKQMQIMADWMVSQKAFKELAIRFGLEKGLSVENVIEKANQMKIDVLNSENDLSHNTNIAGSMIVTPERAKKIKDKLNSK